MIENQMNYDHALAALRDDDLNPWVRAEISFNKRVHSVDGLEEAIRLLKEVDPETPFTTHNTKTGGRLRPSDTAMVLIGRAIDILPLESLICPILSQTTTLNQKNNIDRTWTGDTLEQTLREIVEIDEGKSRSLGLGNAIPTQWPSQSFDDLFKKVVGDLAMDGNISPPPETMVAIYANEFSPDEAAKEALLAYDRVLDFDIPRVATIGFSGKHYDDAIATAQALEREDGTLDAVYINVDRNTIMQGAFEKPIYGKSQSSTIGPKEYYGDGYKFVYGRGVAIDGVAIVKRRLEAAGLDDTKIILRGGFGNPEKISAFQKAEDHLGVRLFDGLILDDLFPVFSARMRITAVGNSVTSEMGE